MPAQPNIPLSQATLLRGLGARVREARQRRGMSMVLLAAGAGITRPMLARLEAGEPSTTLGTLVQVLSVLGIGGEMALLVRGIADPALGTQQAPGQGTSAGPTEPSALMAVIKLADYPVLQSLAWHMGGATAQVTREQALALYERHWPHVNPEDMRTVRNLVDREGIQALFSDRVELARDVKANPYGIRCAIRVDGVPIKFELIHEARIVLDDPLDQDRICGVWRATRTDLVATKLLANVDRWNDAGATSRDLIDLVPPAQPAKPPSAERWRAI